MRKTRKRRPSYATAATAAATAAAGRAGGRAAPRTLFVVKSARTKLAYVRAHSRKVSVPSTISADARARGPPARSSARQLAKLVRRRGAHATRCDLRARMQSAARVASKIARRRRHLVRRQTDRNYEGVRAHKITTHKEETIVKSDTC